MDSGVTILAPRQNCDTDNHRLDSWSCLMDLRCSVAPTYYHRCLKTWSFTFTLNMNQLNVSVNPSALSSKVQKLHKRNPFSPQSGLTSRLKNRVLSDCQSAVNCQLTVLYMLNSGAFCCKLKVHYVVLGRMFYSEEKALHCYF